METNAELFAICYLMSKEEKTLHVWSHDIGMKEHVKWFYTDNRKDLMEYYTDNFLGE